LHLFEEPALLEEVEMCLPDFSVKVIVVNDACKAAGCAAVGEDFHENLVVESSS